MSAALVILALLGNGGLTADDPESLLKSKDATERLAAIAALRSGEHPKAEKLLLSALKDKDWEVIEHAAVALGEVGSPKAVEGLVKVVLDGPAARVRQAAAQAAALLDPDEALATVAKKLAGRSGATALQAIPTLAPAASKPKSSKALSRLLKDKDGRTRAAAARAQLALSREDRAEVLEELLDSEFLALSAAALEVAHSDPRLEQLEVLAEALEQPKLVAVIERRTRAALVATLAGLQDGAERQRQSLARATSLCASKVPAVAARGPRLVRDLLRIELVPPTELMSPLRAALEHEDPAVRAEAVRALRDVGTPEALEQAVILGERDASARVRHAAVSVLSSRPADEEGFDAAWFADRLTGDVDPGVREVAAVALGVAELDGAVKPLMSALEDEQWGVAACAAVSLGLTRAEAGVAALERLYGSKDWRLRGAAVVGLARSLRKEALPVLIEALKDPEPLVVRTAHGFLVSVAHQELEPKASVWKAWWEKNGGRVRLLDPQEVAEREKRFGYTASPQQIYEGLDVLVLQSRGDHIEVLLEAMGIAHRRTGAARLEQDALDASGVFISNCTGEINESDLNRLEWFVRVGGYLFGSCWALQETIERVAPGVVRKFATSGEVLDNVLASPCAPGSPYLEGVFPAGVRPIYALQGAHLIEVLQPERVEVLVDSPECAERWGSGDLACWFRFGHGVIMDSVNHFDLQGLETATHVKRREERMAYAMDHMDLDYERLRETWKEKWWGSNQKASREVRDLSVFTLVTNFVRLRRIEGR